MSEYGPCFECGEQSAFNHHVVPRAQGGKRTVPLCAACHGKIHGRILYMDHRSLIKEGMARARARGKYVGPKPRLTPAQAAELLRQRKAGSSMKALMASYGLTRASIYRYLDRETEMD